MTEREYSIKKITENEVWDVVIIGGGATGLGTALDAASRGFKTLLLEQSDFSKGTSSRSTKLVHGGVRYLAQGNIRLVFHALRERGLLLKNAAHLVKKQAFVIPCFTWWDIFKYFFGLKIYDWISGRHSFGTSVFVKPEGVGNLLPNLDMKRLKGGIKYFDGQFDDARLAINIAQTAIEQGAILLNYVKVTGLIKCSKGIIQGITATDEETNKNYAIQAKTVVNATGVFVDSVLQMDKAGSNPIIRPSQGVHIVLDRKYLAGNTALMIPETTDGRVLFAIPWHDYLLVGTTDTPLRDAGLEPVALDEEVGFILTTANKYLKIKPSREDILSVFAGLRPLAATQNGKETTKEISRDHKLIISDSGLVTITGGKWTTYRKMAEETVDAVIRVGKLSHLPCKSKKLLIHGFTRVRTETELSVYGSDQPELMLMMKRYPALGAKINGHSSYLKVQVIWAVKYEMARNVEDVLARRLRVLFLDANEAIQMAPVVASLMAGELKYDKEWERQQVKQFTQLAQNYLPHCGMLANLNTSDTQ